MLRDRVNILTPTFVQDEQLAMSAAGVPTSAIPFGGRYDQSFNYAIRSIRVDNYTERWLLVAAENFIIPPYRIGFVINLFTQQQRIIIDSIRPPFTQYSPVKAFTGQGNVPSTFATFAQRSSNLPIMLSMFDDPQPEQQPVSMLDMSQAFVTQSHLENVSNPQDPRKIVPFDFGDVASTAWGFPHYGSMFLPTIGLPQVFTGALETTQALQQLRGISFVRAGDINIPAATWTTFYTFPADAANVYSGKYTRMMFLILSCSAAGLLQARDQDIPSNVPGGVFFSTRVAANTPVYLDMQPHGWDSGVSGFLPSNLQVFSTTGGDVAWTLGLGVGDQIT